jgi:hypothetical protein
MKLRATIENGKLDFTGSRQWVKERIKLLQDGDYTVEIKRYRKPRSQPQNAYLHGVLIPCFREALNEAGYDEVKTDEQAKLLIKSMFLRRSVTNHETGEVLEYIQDTSALNTLEMATLYEDVWKFAAEHLNYVIPSPGQQSELILETS